MVIFSHVIESNFQGEMSYSYLKYRGDFMRFCSDNFSLRDRSDVKEFSVQKKKYCSKDSYDIGNWDYLALKKVDIKISYKEVVINSKLIV